MTCSFEDCDNPIEANGMCGSHNRLSRKQKKEPTKKKAIKAFSDKKMSEIKEYSRNRKEFLKVPENTICRVCLKEGADSIHHGMGKIGFADNEARENGISLLLDDRFWIPIHSFFINPEFGCSCHHFIEVNPEYAKKIGVSFDRLNTVI